MSVPGPSFFDNGLRLLYPVAFGRPSDPNVTPNHEYRP